jgi:hypothetical protein
MRNVHAAVSLAALPPHGQYGSNPTSTHPSIRPPIHPPFQIDLLFLYGVLPNSSPDYRGPYGEWCSYFTVGSSRCLKFAA